MKVLLFDTETTDLKGYTIEICCLLCEIQESGLKAVRGTAEALNPLTRVNPEVVRKFSINESALLGKRPFKEFWNKKGRKLFREADLIVAHNVSFDLGVLERELGRMGERFSFPPAFCTCKDLSEILGMSRYPKLERLFNYYRLPSKKAEEIFQKLKEKFNYNPDSIRTRELKYHNALYDTVVLAMIFSKAVQDYKVRNSIIKRANGVNFLLP